MNFFYTAGNENMETVFSLFSRMVRLMSNKS